jgi:glycosyltransferase involved in cell wall biosynthesis
MILISIIIPMYNVAQYLEKCIGSVYNQGLDEREFEVILVDDESPDNSLIVAKNLTIDKGNVTIISQKNKGLGGARNTGILNATGEYLLFLDADDWYLPNVLQSILSIAQEHQLDILEFAAQGITPQGQIQYHCTAKSNTVCEGIAYYNSVRYMYSACNKLYKTDFLKSNSLLFSEHIFIEDFEFNTRTFAIAKRVLATDFLVAQFFLSPNSITRNSDIVKKKKIIKDFKIVLQKTKQTYNNHISANDVLVHHYFKERLGFVIVNLFYQLFKNKATYNHMKKVKQSLIKQDLFYVSHSVFDTNKDWFRKIMLHNFWLFRFTQPIMKLILN